MRETGDREGRRNKGKKQQQGWRERQRETNPVQHLGTSILDCLFTVIV